MWNGENSCVGANSPKNYMYKDNVYILDKIDPDNSADLSGDLSTYVFDEENKNKGKIVKIFINSPGGDTDILFNILSLMNVGRLNGIKFFTIVFGHAGSAASLLACSGDTRIVGESVTNFIHFGYYGTYITKYTEIEKVSGNAKHWHSKIKELYLRACKGKLTEKQLEVFMSDEQTVLKAEDCLKYGLADIIVEDDLQSALFQQQLIENDKKEFEKWRKTHNNSKKTGKKGKK